MPAQPPKMKLQKRVGSEDGRLRTHIGWGAWVPGFPEPTGVGSGKAGTHRVWVPGFPEPTQRGFRESRNPQAGLRVQGVRVHAHKV